MRFVGKKLRFRYDSGLEQLRLDGVTHRRRRWQPARMKNWKDSGALPFYPFQNEFTAL